MSRVCRAVTLLVCGAVTLLVCGAVTLLVCSAVTKRVQCCHQTCAVLSPNVCRRCPQTSVVLPRNVGVPSLNKCRDVPKRAPSFLLACVMSPYVCGDVP